MKPRLPFNHLNTFAEAAEHLSFQQAARNLHVTPSAVSHQVRNLEALLGYPLFDRVDKGVELTARGSELFDRIAKPLRQLHDASEVALRLVERDVLTVSVAPVFATRWLVPRLSSFRRAHPDVSLSVIATADLLDFRSDDIDCAIRIGPGDWDGADAELLFRPAVAAVCDPTLLSANGKQFAPRELSDKKRVANLGMPDLWNQWLSAAGVPKVAQPPAVQVQSAAQVLETIQAGDYVGLLDLNLIGTEVDNGKIALACSFVFDQGDGYYFVLPQDRKVSHVARLFIDWLRDQVSET